ncbi:hypothetical protein M2360_001629 [Rhizobium sp. SG_E_25_P2]|uniref:hypothetical protein n=1 Tax=Rhizobium sp. SG_E_25_P2 TaxID=2879942 RepID=UPI002473B800|nr:hypothetical protein [Rhizobium sp. SG_E_25_P2]MDH6266233.1 hypothetical protein [Rhizobium sp. SG_E_25_P2]
MTRFRPRKDLRNVVMTLRLVCALAIAMIGFAHQPVFAAQAFGYDVSVLPDGEIAAMCLSSSEEGVKKGAVGNGMCEACRLSAACLLPAPSDVHAAVIRTALAFPAGNGREGPPLDVLSYRGAPRASPCV